MKLVFYNLKPLNFKSLNKLTVYLIYIIHVRKSLSRYLHTDYNIKFSKAICKIFSL